MFRAVVRLAGSLCWSYLVLIIRPAVHLGVCYQLRVSWFELEANRESYYHKFPFRRPSSQSDKHVLQLGETDQG